MSHGTNIGCGLAHKVMHKQCDGQSNQLWKTWQDPTKDAHETHGIMLTSRYYAPGEELCLVTNGVGNVYMTGCRCRKVAGRNKWSNPHLKYMLTDHAAHPH